MLTVELNNASEATRGNAVVEIICDADGLELLKRQLDFLKTAPSHVHLMTPSWAGAELNEVPHGPGNTLVNHLRIQLIPKA